MLRLARTVAKDLVLVGLALLAIDNTKLEIDVALLVLHLDQLGRQIRPHGRRARDMPKRIFKTSKLRCGDFENLQRKMRKKKLIVFFFSLAYLAGCERFLFLHRNGKLLVASPEPHDHSVLFFLILNLINTKRKKFLK